MAGVTVAAGLGARAAEGAIWRTAGFACLAVGGYVVSVLLARSLGPAAYSVYGIIYSLLVTAELVLRLGIPQSLTRMLGAAHGTVPAIEGTGLTLAVLANLAGFAVLWTCAPMLAGLLNVADGARLLRIAILDLPFFAAYLCLSHILLGRRNFRASGLATCVYALVKLAGIVLLQALGRLTIEGALIVNVIASVATMVIIAPRVGRAGLRLTTAARAPLVALAAPITFADFGAQVLVGFDLWALGALGTTVPDEVKGQYVAALSVARIPNVVAFVLASVLVPSIARALGSADPAAARPLVQGAARALAVLLLPGCVLVAVNANELIALLYSDAYRAGGRYLAVLIFAHGFGFTSLLVLQSMLVSVDATAAGALRIHAAAALAIVLGLLLVPRLGADGAACAALVALGAAVMALGRAVRRRLGMTIAGRDAFLVLLSSGAIGLAGWLIPARGVLVVAEIAGLGLAYLVLAAAVGLIRPGDVDLFRAQRAVQAT